jgi:universal stress protein F
MYKSILVPVDLGHGELGKMLLAKALQLLDAGGTIRLLYVIEDIPAYIAAEIPDKILSERKSEALASLKALAADSGAQCEAQIRHGSPSIGILGAAEEHGCDLIMIASHRPDLRDYFIGSTAAKVVRHAKCSVLIVR